MKSHRRSSSMFQLPAERPQSSRPWSSKQEQAHQLRPKADELETEKPQSSAHRINPTRVSRLGDARLDSAPGVVDEMPLRYFREPTIGLVEYDGDLLLNMVDNLQINMKQSLLGSTKGRFYDRYMERRHAKLRQERGSSEWARIRETMKAMEDTLEKILAEMKNRCRDPADKKASVLRRRPILLTRQRSFSIGSTIEFKKKHVVEDIAEPSQSDKHKSLGTFLMDDPAEIYNSSKLLSSEGAYSSTSPNLTEPILRSLRSGYSSSTKQTADSAYPLVQITVESSDLRKENLRPLARVGKAITRSDPVTFDRSRSSAAGIDIFKEEKKPRFRHMRNSSVTFGELKEFVPLNSNSSNRTLSSYSKDQSDNTVTRKIQFGGESKPFLRRGDGKRPGLATSIAKSRVSNASDSWNKKENGVELVNQQEYSAGLIENTDEEFQRRWDKRRDYIVPSELNNEEERSSNAGSSGGITFVDEDNVSSGFSSNSPWNVDGLHPSCSSAQEAPDSGVFMSMGTPIRNKHHLNLMREADATRVRKKWGNVEKPKFATDDSERPLKDVGKVLKKMLSFGSKSKNAERTVNFLTTPVSSEDGVDTVEYSDLGKQSLHEFSKSRKAYLGSSNIALHDDRILLGKVPDSCISFSSFNRRGSAVKA